MLWVDHDNRASKCCMSIISTVHVKVACRSVACRSFELCKQILCVDHFKRASKCYVSIISTMHVNAGCRSFQLCK